MAYKRILIRDTRTAKQLGITRVKHNKLYVLVECSECHKERWISKKTLGGLVYEGLCRHCASVRRGLEYVMEKSNRWSGGRHIKNGYVMIAIPHNSQFYPMARRNSAKSGYILEHRLVMAKHLNRCLRSWEIVHHRNGVKDDNRIENLELLSYTSSHLVDMETKLYIRKLERRITELEAKLGELH